MIKAAWIGLGVMGFHMAGHLARSGGVQLTVYNRTQEKAKKWCETFDGKSAETPYLAAQDADFVFSCVGNDQDLREVTIGKAGAFAAMSPGAVFVDHTTASADVARELHEHACNQGIDFIDAPVSGGEVGAQKAMLTIMCGGKRDAYEKAERLMAAYARKCQLVGVSGSGQLAKMCNQITLAGTIQSLAESLEFGKRAGLDMTAVIEVMLQGAARSWQMENRSETMVVDEFDFGFAVDLVRKDFNICLTEARRMGMSLPLVALVDQFYADVQNMGGGRWDTSSLIKRLYK